MKATRLIKSNAGILQREYAIRYIMPRPHKRVMARTLSVRELLRDGSCYDIDLCQVVVALQEGLQICGERRPVPYDKVTSSDQRE